MTMPSAVLPLSQSAFRQWGEYIPADETRNRTELASALHFGNIAVFSMQGELSASILRPFRREPVLRFMEMHRETAELCVELENDSVIVVAADREGKPDAATLQAFLLRQGDSVVYNPSVWHWVPYPVSEDGSRQLIVYKNHTGTNDFHKEELARPIALPI